MSPETAKNLRVDQPELPDIGIVEKVGGKDVLAERSITLIHERLPGMESRTTGEIKDFVDFLITKIDAFLRESNAVKRNTHSASFQNTLVRAMFNNQIYNEMISNWDAFCKMAKEHMREGVNGERLPVQVTQDMEHQMETMFIGTRFLYDAIRRSQMDFIKKRKEGQVQVIGLEDYLDVTKAVDYIDVRVGGGISEIILTQVKTKATHRQSKSGKKYSEEEIKTHLVAAIRLSAGQHKRYIKGLPSASQYQQEVPKSIERIIESGQYFVKEMKRLEGKESQDVSAFIREYFENFVLEIMTNDQVNGDTIQKIAQENNLPIGLVKKYFSLGDSRSTFMLTAVELDSDHAKSVYKELNLWAMTNPATALELLMISKEYPNTSQTLPVVKISSRFSHDAGDHEQVIFEEMNLKAKVLTNK
ncbi:MAG: hypothetical protein V1695_01970 [Candidatus Uhrbacteria bacterium]